MSLGALRLTYPATWHADVPEQRRFDAVPRVQPLLTGAHVLSTEPFVRMCSRPGFGVAGVCYRSVRLGADGIVVGLSTFHDATYSTYHVLDQRVAGRPAEFGDQINTAGTCPLGTGSATYAVVALGHARYASAFACLGTKATGAEDEFRTMLATATYRP